MMVKCHRREIVLLEVLIAFSLVVLCALPLIYPHMEMFKSERRFIDMIELDHVVNLLYGNRLEKLYLREISWENIEGGIEMPIDATMIKESGWKRDLPFTGHYKFRKEKFKPTEAPEDAVYLFQLSFVFNPKFQEKNKKSYVYEYEVVIERQPT